MFDIVLLEPKQSVWSVHVYCPKPHDVLEVSHYFANLPLSHIKGVEHPNSVRDLFLSEQEKELLVQLKSAACMVQIKENPHWRIHRKRLGSDQKFIEHSLNRFSQIGAVRALGDPNTETRVWELNEPRYQTLVQMFCNSASET